MGEKITMAERLARGAVRDPITDCLVWTRSLDKDGYASLYELIGPRHTRRVRAHRVAYQLAKGEIPAGMQIDHVCRNRRCVNPEHLEAVTSRENTMRGLSSAAERARQTHCVRGHIFDAENTMLRPNGYRQCRACHRAWQLRHYHEGKRKERRP